MIGLLVANCCSAEVGSRGLRSPRTKEAFSPHGDFDFPARPKQPPRINFWGDSPTFQILIPKVPRKLPRKLPRKVPLGKQNTRRKPRVFV